MTLDCSCNLPSTSQLLKFATFFFIVTGFFLAVSLAAHVCALFGIPIIGDWEVITLHVTMLLIGIPAGFYCRNWKDAERHRQAQKKIFSPTLKAVSIALFIYVFLTIALFVLAKFFEVAEPANDSEDRAWAIQVFSAVWTFFYFLFTTVYFALHSTKKTTTL